MLQNKKILVGICGSIAAYKSILLIRLLIKAGAEVRVILTPAAQSFVTPLTLSTLSKNKVLINIFEENEWENHVMLGRWADVFIIAPLSCNTLSKMASGQCDNLLLAVYLSAVCKVIAVPAMDEDMWQHPATKENLRKIISYNNNLISVCNGELASGLIGEGRMAEPQEIINYVENILELKKQTYQHKVLITAGPTQEALDPVRYISNHSTGKMGVAIANEFKNRGAEVTLILGPTQNQFNTTGIKVIHVITADEMYKASLTEFKKCHTAVMCAAVADYTPVQVAKDKIKKKENTLTIQLKKTKDILQTLGELKKPTQFLAGFALETNQAKANAIQKLKTKNADMIVLNNMQDKGAGFSHNTNKVCIFSKSGLTFNFELKTKTETAVDIVDTIIKLQND